MCPDQEGASRHQMSTDCVRITVLLVDDQPFVGSVLGRLLATEKDIELQCCHQATEAVARANQVRPTLILQDVVMPDIDGLTLVGLFRANAATAETPVVVLSGDDDAASRTRALQAGASDYLVKLPAKDALIECIRRHATPALAGNRADGARAPAGGEPGADVTLDPLVIAAFRDDGPTGSCDFAFMLIDQFIQEAETRVATLGDAARRQDAGALKATAHALKGSSLIMGAKRLGALCGQLEEAVQRPPGPALAPAVMSAIAEELVNVRAAFAVERQRMAQQPPSRPSSGRSVGSTSS